ncbi:hypothetical protein KEM48_009698 [Puccinia striiformis f. sp. tritici PST-130]|nr:hypothetical protein KEM48_009698 [Puccinia striiformis f. sp. tritici PST-130]
MTNQYTQNPLDANKNVFITPTGEFVTPEAYLASLSLPAAPLRQQQQQVLNSQPHQHQRQSIYQQPNVYRQQSESRQQQPEQRQQFHQQHNPPGLSLQHQQQSNLPSPLRSQYRQQQQQSSPPAQRYHQQQQTLRQQHISFNTNDASSEYPSNHNRNDESVNVHEHLASVHLKYAWRIYSILKSIANAFPPLTSVNTTPINRSAPAEITLNSTVTADSTNSNQHAWLLQKQKQAQKKKPQQQKAKQPPKSKPPQRNLTKATYNAAVGNHSPQPPSQFGAAISNTRTVTLTTSDVPGSSTTPEERRGDEEDVLSTRLDRVVPVDALGRSDRVVPEDVLGNEQGMMDEAEQGLDLFDQLDDNDDVPVIQKPCNMVKKPRMLLDAETVASLPDQTMDELRRLADEHGHYERLTAEDRLEFQNIYNQYQRDIYILAISKMYKITAALNCVGNASTCRGPNMYNNFIRYNPEINKIWNDHEPSQEKYKDPEFLATFPPPVEKTHPEHGAPNHKKKPAFDGHRWAQKMFVDLKRFGERYHIETFLGVVSRDVNSSLVLSGGSAAGEYFFDLYPADQNPLAKFFRVVHGLETVKEITGKAPPALATDSSTKTKNRQPRRGKDDDQANREYCMGGRVKNGQEIRRQLIEALDHATNQLNSNGWPGKDTNGGLAALGVTLRVETNNLKVKASDFCGNPSAMPIARQRRLLAALKEGWVELVGPCLEDDSTPIGAHNGMGDLESANRVVCGARQPKKKVTKGAGVQGQKQKQHVNQSETAGTSHKRKRPAKPNNGSTKSHKRRKASDFVVTDSEDSETEDNRMEIRGRGGEREREREEEEENESEEGNEV